jgi:hypothetical protein
METTQKNDMFKVTKKMLLQKKKRRKYSNGTLKWASKREGMRSRNSPFGY